MFEVESKIWQEDIETIANNDILELFKNSCVLVTGASGLIGSELVFSFLCANRIKNLNIKVIALIRNKEKAEKLFKNVLNNSNLKIIVQDIKEKIKIKDRVDYIIHSANITSSSDMVKRPVDTILTTFLGTKNVLDFCIKNSAKMAYLSSIEAYGTINDRKSVKENDFGYVDLMNPRSSYPESKRMAENLCASYCSQFGTDVKIIRLTQTFGAGVSKCDSRVFVQFAKSIIKKEDIVLKTKGESYKSYCYLTDAVLAILLILARGESANIYNVANKNSAISIKDMALMLCHKHKTSNLKIEIDKNAPYACDTYLDLNCEKLKNLGFEASISLDKMYDRLIGYLKEVGM